MRNIIDEVNFHELEAQRYWTPPASWTEQKKKTEITSSIFSGNYIGARKMDGAFYKFVKDEDGNMELLGRSRSVTGDYIDKIEYVPHLNAFFNSLPNGTCLIGEIYFPDHEGSNNVTTIMGCLKDKALRRQENCGKLHYYVFDVLAFNGKSCVHTNIEDRINILKNIFSSNAYDYVESAIYYTGEDLWNQLQMILADGGEGVVITKIGTCYQPGKRPAHQTIKVKKELQETIDAVIISANNPTKTYKGKDIINWDLWENVRTGEKIKGQLYKSYSDGYPIEPVTKTYWNDWAGSLNIGLYDEKNNKYVLIGSVSGLTDEVLENWKDYIGKVVEIGGMQLMYDSNGKFSGIRHPRVLKFRDDKNPKDCSITQIR